MKKSRKNKKQASRITKISEFKSSRDFPGTAKGDGLWEKAVLDSKFAGKETEREKNTK